MNSDTQGAPLTPEAKSVLRTITEFQGKPLHCVRVETLGHAIMVRSSSCEIADLLIVEVDGKEVYFFQTTGGAR